MVRRVIPVIAGTKPPELRPGRRPPACNMRTHTVLNFFLHFSSMRAAAHVLSVVLSAAVFVAAFSAPPPSTIGGFGRNVDIGT